MLTANVYFAMIIPFFVQGGSMALSKKVVTKTNDRWPKQFLIRQQNRLSQSLAEQEVLAQRVKKNLKESSQSIFTGDSADQSAYATAVVINTQLLEMNPISRIKIALGLISTDLRSPKNKPHEYGRCRGCEETITHRRLDARPDALLCCECQSEAEGKAEGKAKEIVDSEEEEEESTYKFT